MDEAQAKRSQLEEAQARRSQLEEAQAKRSQRRKLQAIDVAILYNVDFTDATPAGDTAYESRATVQSVAFDVEAALIADGAHTATLIPVEGDFAELRARLEAQSPACVFNLCESLGGDARLETVLPTVLDLMGLPYTGSPPPALSAALYKDRVKARLIEAGVPTPRGVLLHSADDPFDVPYPVIVKPSREDGSAGITAKSVCHDEASVRARAFDVIDAFKAPVLVEQFIDGREFNVAMLGYPQARVLPLQEIDFSALPDDRPKIVSYDAKWLTGSIDDLGTQPVIMPQLPPAIAARIRRVASDAFRAVGVRDYGRVDVRLSSNGTPYVVDVNPNCDLSPDAGFARAANSVGIDYPALMRLLVRYARSRRKEIVGTREARTATSGRDR